MSLSELHQEGYKRAVVKFVENQYTKQFNIWASQNKYHKICPDERFVKMCQKLRNAGKMYGYWFITLNPPTDDLELLHRVVEKIRGYKNVLGDMTYTFEQRSVKPPYKGYHVHILAEDVGIKQQELIKRCHSACTTGKHCFPGMEKSAVDVKHSNKDALDYIKGIKKDPAKMAKVRADREFREERGYEDTYFLPRFPSFA